MQTLCKPSRRIYDTKAIVACDKKKPDDNSTADEQHNLAHLITEAGIGAAAAGVPGGNIVKVAAGGIAAAVIWANEVQDSIAHGLDEAMDYFNKGGSGTTGPGTSSGSSAAAEASGIGNIDPVTGQPKRDG
jgi:hypothetical protein